MIKLVQKDNGALNLAQKLQKGEDGGYYIPTVDENGNLSWQPTREDMIAAMVANILGPMGPQGACGIYVGEDEPTDENILVWLIPTGETSDFVMTEKEVKNYIDTSLEEVANGTY
jgi:hypothetical protein